MAVGKTDYQNKKIEGGVNSSPNIEKGTKLRFLKSPVRAFSLGYEIGSSAIFFDNVLINKLIKAGYAEKC